MTMERDGWSCVDCGSRDELHVHHLTYERFSRESIWDLVTLCRPCHKIRHKTIPRNEWKGGRLCRNPITRIHDR